MKQIANLIGISSLNVFRILKKHHGLQKVSARWILHILAEKQTQLPVEMCRY